MGRNSDPAFGLPPIHLDYRVCKSPQPNHRSQLDLNPGPKNGNPEPYPLCHTTEQMRKTPRLQY